VRSCRLDLQLPPGLHKITEGEASHALLSPGSVRLRIVFNDLAVAGEYFQDAGPTERELRRAGAGPLTDDHPM